MEAYRDQYATLFNNGKKVVVIGISTDADTTQANWARESGFPNLFASDPDQTVAKSYGSADGKADTRNVFVVSPAGTGAPYPTLLSLRGDHPIPGRSSFAAAAKIGDVSSGRRGTDVAIVLISGGTTSLIAAPLRGMNETDLTLLYERLLE